MKTSNPTRIPLGLLSLGLLLLPLVGLLVLPSVLPGLGAGDLLAKRMLLYILAFGLSAIWLLSAIRMTASMPTLPLALPATAYVAFNLFSLSWAINPFSGIVEAAQLVALLIIFFGIVFFLGTNHILTLAQFSAVGGLLVSIIGIGQYLGRGFEWIPSVGLPSGGFLFRHLAAAYLVGNIPFGLLAISLDPSRLRKILWSIATTSMSLFLVYTRTRGAWIGLGGAILLACIYLGFNRPLRQNLAGRFGLQVRCRALFLGVSVTLIVLVGGALLPTRTSKEVYQRFDEKKSSPAVAATSLLAPGSDRGRLAMWKHTIEIIADNPLTGVGLDNWEFVYPRYDRGDKITGASEPVRPHNDFLWIASELGLIGLALYLWLLFVAFRTVHRLLQRGSEEAQATVLACGVALVALLGHSCFSFLRERPAPSALSWLSLGIISLLSAQRTSPRGHSGFRVAVPALGLLISLGALYLTWRHIHFDRYFHRALAYAESDAWTAVERETRLALRNGTFDHRARFLLAKALQGNGRFEEAERAYLGAQLVHPNYAHTHHNLGRVYEAKKDWSRAITSFRRAIEINPGYDKARIHLGNAYVSTGRLDEAIREFQHVVSRGSASEEHVEARGNLGVAYLQIGDLDQAMAELQGAIRWRPNYPEALNNLAYVYELKGLYRESIQAYQSVLRHWKGDPSYRETIERHIQTLQSQIAQGK